MIRSPIGLRLNPSLHVLVRDALREAAALGVRGVVLSASGELGPERLSQTGRRELRHFLRGLNLEVFAMHLPTRRGFDTLAELDDRLTRADRAFQMAFELGTRRVLLALGPIAPETDLERSSALAQAGAELAKRADHRGVQVAVETGPDAGQALRAWLDARQLPALAASLDPAALLAAGQDPVAAARSLGPHVIHAYASDPDSREASSRLHFTGSSPRSLDWMEYLGALEEIDYRGPLTILPCPDRDLKTQVGAILAILSRF